jgi:hypothetical protein
MKFLFWLIFLFAALPQVKAQQKWVQMFVDGLQSEQDCRFLEESFYEMEGIANVRAESVQGNLLIFIKENYNYSEEELTSRVTSLGFYGWCYRTGIAGVHPVTRISRSTCEPLQEQK